MQVVKVPTDALTTDTRLSASEDAVTSAKQSSTSRAPLLDIGGVADWLGTSHRHVRRLVAERRIPHLKVGHFVRFDSDEIVKWIDAQPVGSANPPDS